MPMEGGIAMQTWDPAARTLPPPTPKGQALRGLDDMALDTEMQMTTLLRPFAQHVRDLQATVSELSDRLQRADARMDMQDKRLADQTTWGQQLKSAVDPMKAHMTALQNGVTQLNREKTMLEQEHEETKAAVREIVDRLDGVNSFGQGLQGSMAAQGNSIEQLRSDLQDVRSHISDSVEATLGQHAQQLTELQHGLLDLDRVVGERGQALDDHLRAYKSFRQEHTKQTAEDQRSIHNLMQQLKRLHALMDDSDGRIASQAEELKGTNDETLKLGKLLAKLDAQAAALKDREEKLSREVVGWQSRIPPLEKGLHQLMEVANRPVKAREEDTQRKMRNIGEFLHELEDTVLTHRDQIKELQASQNDRDSQAAKGVDTVHKQIKDLHANIGQVNDDIKELHAMHGTSRGLIDSSMTMHSDAKVEFSNNEQRVCHLRSEVNGLQLQLRDATDSIAKLYTSLELCHDYMSGMRKGIRDANARVVGTDDPLLPEPRQRSMTPVLPNMRKSTTPSTAFGASCRESPASCASPGVMGSARGDPGNLASPPPLGPNRGVFANSTGHGDGRGHRVVSR